MKIKFLTSSILHRTYITASSSSVFVKHNFSEKQNIASKIICMDSFTQGKIILIIFLIHHANSALFAQAPHRNGNRLHAMLGVALAAIGLKGYITIDMALFIFICWVAISFLLNAIVSASLSAKNFDFAIRLCKIRCTFDRRWSAKQSMSKAKWVRSASENDVSSYALHAKEMMPDELSVADKWATANDAIELIETENENATLHLIELAAECGYSRITDWDKHIRILINAKKWDDAVFALQKVQPVLKNDLNALEIYAAGYKYLVISLSVDGLYQKYERELSSIYTATKNKTKTQPYKKKVVVIYFIFALIGLGHLFSMVTATESSSQDSIANLTVAGGLIPSFVQAGQYWRIITSCFLHAGLLHLFMNCLWLYYIGPLVEQCIGKRNMVSLFIISAMCGSIITCLVYPEPTVSVGASGGMMGLLGALGVAGVRGLAPLSINSRKSVLKYIGIIVAWNAVLGLSIPQINNAAHAAGFISGAIITEILRQRKFAIHNFMRSIICLASIVAMLLSFYALGIDYKNGSAPPTLKAKIFTINTDLNIALNEGWVMADSEILAHPLFGLFQIKEVNNILDIKKYFENSIKASFPEGKLTLKPAPKKHEQNTTIKIYEATLKAKSTSKVMFLLHDTKYDLVLFGATNETYNKYTKKLWVKALSSAYRGKKEKNPQATYRLMP